MPHLAMLGVGCPLWVRASANALNFQGHPPLEATRQLNWHTGYNFKQIHRYRYSLVNGKVFRYRYKQIQIKIVAFRYR